MNWLKRFWNGELPLASAFWLYGVVVNVVITFVGPFLLFPLVAMGGGGSQALALAVGALIVAYQILAVVGIWRSAGRHAGRAVWAVAARVAALAFLVWLAVGIGAAWRLLNDDSRDTSRTSATVAATLRRDPAYPLTGFWKGECHEAFGLAIEPSAAPGKYSVSFCGPGGCFKPGTYRPDTTIKGDDAYRIVDPDTLEVAGRGGYSRYVRCE